MSLQPFRPFCFPFVILSLCVLPQCFVAGRDDATADLSKRQIGYTEYQANLPGGMHPYFTSQRACVVNADGSNHRRIADELLTEPHTWTQFAGWSPGGRFAIVIRGWESPENAAWEEANQTFRMTEGWLVDVYLLEMQTGAFVNLTKVDRVSRYNTGLFFWPNVPQRLGFQALLDGVSCPFSMDLDGHNKKNLTDGSTEFTYGFNASPDGERITYHKNYKVYLADADGSNSKLVETGNPFNFVPQWSPDGQWVLFVSGEHYDCHPHVVRRDGSDLKQIGDRNGYRGVVECIDIPAFHSASSDVPVWSTDRRAIYFTAQVEDCVELMRADLDGAVTRLTHSKESALNYHPSVSSEGAWLAYGSDRTGTRQLYVLPTAGGKPQQFTNVLPGYGAMHAHWRPDESD